MSLPPVGPWMMWVGIGLPAYLFLCFGIGKTIAVGMGSDEPSERQVVHDAFDGLPFAGLPQQKTPPV